MAAAEAFANQLVAARGSIVSNNLAELIDGAGKWKSISTASEFNNLPPDPDIVSARSVFLPRKSNPFKLRPKFSRTAIIRKKYFK